MKRLIAYHDQCSRDRALVYVDGDIYAGDDHFGIIIENFDPDGDLDLDDFTNEHDVAFAHMVDSEKAIYVENDSMSQQISMEEAAAGFKNKYPNYAIYNDDDENCTKVAAFKEVNADAYDWVAERAKHIQDKNSDMEEGESYGIAWKQYKKEHPGWKSKKEKEKKKKKVSRLKLAYELDNKEDDNSDLYYQIEDLIEQITREFDTMLDVDDCFTNVDTITGGIESVSSLAQSIHDAADAAKDNGIHNENQLSIGKDQIKELERDLKELTSDLEDVLSDNEGLRSDIEAIESDIQRVEQELDRISSEIVASESRGMVHEEGRHVFICYAHDEIMKSADLIIKDCTDTETKINDALSEADGNNDTDIADKIHDLADDLQNETSGWTDNIERSMSEAKNMNSKMGNGITSKNETIEELSESISEKQDQIVSEQDDNADLKYKLSELKSLLDQLESELANI